MPHRISSSTHHQDTDKLIKIKSLTWNIEGLKRNIYNLKHFLDLTMPDLVFLSEPNVFNNELKQLAVHFSDKYNWYLNSEDNYDQEAPFIKNYTHGGTLALWKHDIDAFISAYPVSTTSFLPLVFAPPGSPVSIHIALYLPTSGQEAEFVWSLG